MKGKNQITLNQATMVLAIQHYFESIVFKEGSEPQVIAVASKKEESTNRSYGNVPASEEFIISVDDKTT